MERRYIVFILLVALIWLSWIPLQIFLASKRPPPAKKPGPAAVAQADGKAKEEKEAKDEGKPAEEARPAGAAEKDAAERAKPVAGPEVARQWLTLGSADPESGYSGVYYFDNRGAAVECVELNGKHYKSVEDYSGYFGRLNLMRGPDGSAIVNMVGAGTPAAQAKATGVQPGLAVGDAIESIDGVPIETDGMLAGYLEKTRPGQTVTLVVRRKGVEKPIEFRAELTRRPLEVVQPEAHHYKLPKGGPKTLPRDPLSLLVTLESVGVLRIKPDQERDLGRPAEIVGLPSLYTSNWKVEQQGEGFIEFSFTLDAEAMAEAKIEKAWPLKVIKRYTLAKAEKPGDAANHLDLQIRIENQGEQAIPVAYRLNGPTGLPLEGWWYSTKLHPKMWTAAGARDVAYQQQGFGHFLMGCPQIVSDARKALEDEKEKGLPRTDLRTGDQATPFDYLGVDTQFFASVIQPLATTADQKVRFLSAYAWPVQDVTPIPKTRLRTADVSFYLSTQPAIIEPGGELKHEYRVFFGPKDPNVLSQYRLDALIEYGWPIFAYPAKLLRSVLNGLYGLTGLVGMPNYGIAIILLTVIVRTCMIPVSLKQARSAAKMQELAPEVQKIKDKNPDDPMKQHQAVQELYKKHDFNMFGGCLPVFIQLPIFIGLYRCLSVDIDLRDAALIPGISWASNLAGPDKLFRWDSWLPAFLSDEADGYLGPFFNVFPLITIVLFLIQQKMFTPPATDEQTKMQQQMMMFMTVFMGFMFFKVPAGLCIYFITSSLWGICERKLLPKAQPKGGGGGGGVVTKLPAKPTSPNGSSRAGSKRPKQKR